MNWFDIVLIAVLVLSTLAGIWQGLVMMVLPVVGIVIGTALAGYYSASLGNLLSIDNPQHAQWAGYLIILFGTLVLAVILSIILHKVISFTPLKWVDKLVGGILGLALGILLCATMLAVCIKCGMGTDFIQGSGIAQFMLDWFPAILILLPSDFDSVKDFFQ
jgi:membrane protein required for colicin V production